MEKVKIYHISELEKIRKKDKKYKNHYIVENAELKFIKIQNDEMYSFINCIIKCCKITSNRISFKNCTIYASEIYCNSISFCYISRSKVTAGSVEFPESIYESKINAKYTRGYDKLTGFRYPVYIGYSLSMKTRFISIGCSVFSYAEFKDKEKMQEVIEKRAWNAAVKREFELMYKAIMQIIEIYEINHQ